MDFFTEIEIDIAMAQGVEDLSLVDSGHDNYYGYDAGFADELAIMAEAIGESGEIIGEFEHYNDLEPLAIITPETAEHEINQMLLGGLENTLQDFWLDAGNNADSFIFEVALDRWLNDLAIDDIPDTAESTAATITTPTDKNADNVVFNEEPPNPGPDPEDEVVTTGTRSTFSGWVEFYGRPETISISLEPDIDEIVVTGVRRDGDDNEVSIASILHLLSTLIPRIEAQLDYDMAIMLLDILSELMRQGRFDDDPSITNDPDCLRPPFGYDTWVQFEKSLWADPAETRYINAVASLKDISNAVKGCKF